MGQNLRILSVNAHPHDFTHYAGTLGIHAAAGDEVTVVSVTTGEATHNEALHDELMKPEAERDPAIINQAAGDYSAVKGSADTRSSWPIMPTTPAEAHPVIRRKYCRRSSISGCRTRSFCTWSITKSPSRLIVRESAAALRFLWGANRLPFKASLSKRMPRCSRFQTRRLLTTDPCLQV